jgi:transcriptional regulator with XRE-family HTH domain
MLRKKMGLTQQALGRLLGISEQAIQRWERGVHVPRKEHLESLITLCLQRHAFCQERGRGSPTALAGGRAARPTALSEFVVLKREVAQSAEPRAKPELASLLSHVYWGDALDVHAFYGREAELLQLEQWVLQERCQVVSVLGMGGIGPMSDSSSATRVD